MIGIMSPARKRSTSKEKSAPGHVRASLKEYQRKRDFALTDEPSGDKAPSAHGQSLAFVIQKHAASHLHFDLRLEVDGVMKSWAVPKGPSVDPSVKRLAMQVEDHPVAYNTFEGTIPQGEYGGGTVMLWDHGTYTPDETEAGESDNAAAKRALDAGKLAFTFHGERLHGSFALVRTRRGADHAQWLLIKHKDKYAKVGRDIVAQVTTSVESGRRMEDIAAGDHAQFEALESSDALTPMEASKAKLPLPPGIYAVESAASGSRVLVFLANGTVKVMQAGTARATQADSLENTPAVQAELLRVARHRSGPLVLDGYLDNDTLTVVDLLMDNDATLVNEPWIERRQLLDGVFTEITGHSRSASALSLHPWRAATDSDVRDAARELAAHTIIAKRIDAPYESGPSKLWLHIPVKSQK